MLATLSYINTEWIVTKFYFIKEEISVACVVLDRLYTVVLCQCCSVAAVLQRMLTVMFTAGRRCIQSIFVIDPRGISLTVHHSTDYGFLKLQRGAALLPGPGRLILSAPAQTSDTTSRLASLRSLRGRSLRSFPHQTRPSRLCFLRGAGGRDRSGEQGGSDPGESTQSRPLQRRGARGSHLTRPAGRMHCSNGANYEILPKILII